jgi:ComF family protein
VLKLVKYFSSSISHLLFPEVCLLCGTKVSGKFKIICTECAVYKFESATETYEDRINMPEGVSFRVALWSFDKGGYLQEILHKLKYHRLTAVGEDLGLFLGARIKKIPAAKILNKENSLILPVPLHPRKKRMRGFNQARYIAMGVSEVLGFPLCDPKSVRRIKNTKSQTGYSLKKRRANISKAFRMEDAEEITGKHIIIIDDVFTTGATTFELANELKIAKPSSICIATVAQA